MNITHLMGNLGQEPDLHVTENGFHICKLSLATSRNVKKGDEWEKVSDWHNVKLLGKKAEIAAKYLKKGSKVLITGASITESYEKDGEKKYYSYVLGNELEFAGGSDKTDTAPQATKVEATFTEKFESGDIPF